MSLFQPTPSEGQSAVTLLEAFAAFALIAGVLIAVADTRAYPLALGIVAIALLYTVVGHPAILTGFSGLLNTAAGKISGGSSSSSAGGSVGNALGGA